jgi:hypothetical protein
MSVIEAAVPPRCTLGHVGSAGAAARFICSILRSQPAIIIINGDYIFYDKFVLLCRISLYADLSQTKRHVCAVTASNLSLCRPWICQCIQLKNKKNYALSLDQQKLF